MFKKAIIVASLVASGSAFADSAVFKDPYGGYADHTNTVATRQAAAPALAGAAIQKDWFERTGVSTAQ